MGHFHTLGKLKTWLSILIIQLVLQLWALEGKSFVSILISSTCIEYNYIIKIVLSCKFGIYFLTILNSELNVSTVSTFYVLLLMFLYLSAFCLFR